ncbi:hypothetical protein HYT23_04720 [Candidatus Pacearchaeota archaeon]|nr:hypothetical protein [Candidatus Pacearchaeota archaeon]
MPRLKGNKNLASSEAEIDREGNKVSVSRVIIAFLISAAVLIFAFSAGYMVSFLNYQRVSATQNIIKNDILSTQLSGELLQECNDDAFNLFSRKLDESGALISIMEERFGKNDENVLEQKKQYTLLELQHFLAVEKYAEACNKDIDFIFFFYSNSNEYGNNAENIGKILGRVKDQKEEKVMIYSFDYDLDMETVQLLRYLYKVYYPNSVVVNKKIVLRNVQNIDEVNEALESK